MALLPALGFPHGLDSAFVVLSGLSVAALALRVRKEKYVSMPESPFAPSSAFVEKKPGRRRKKVEKIKSEEEELKNE